MELEDALCSKVRIKILTLLFERGQLNTSEIAERVGGNYRSVHRHLDVLEREGVLEMTPFGVRIRYYNLNESSPKVHAVKALFEAWKS